MSESVKVEMLATPLGSWIRQVIHRQWPGAMTLLIHTATEHETPHTVCQRHCWIICVSRAHCRALLICWSWHSHRRNGIKTFILAVIKSALYVTSLASLIMYPVKTHFYTQGDSEKKYSNAKTMATFALAKNIFISNFPGLFSISTQKKCLILLYVCQSDAFHFANQFSVSNFCMIFQHWETDVVMLHRMFKMSAISFDAS